MEFLERPSKWFRTSETRDLGDRFKRREIVSREESDRLDRLLSEEVATIGIAGPRGYGKTSVMRRAVEDRPVGVWFPCPPKEACNEREFTFALFERLCRDVAEEIEKLYPYLSFLGRISQWPLRLAAALFSASLAVVAAWFLFRDLTFSSLLGPSLAYYAVPSLLVILPLIFFSLHFSLGLNVRLFLTIRFVWDLAWRFFRRQSPSSGDRARPSLRAGRKLESLRLRSKQRLETLRYAESLQRSGGVEIAPTQAIKVSGHVARQLQRRPLTYVAVLDEFRRYTGAVSRDFQHIVVAIDEIDKLEPEEARDFLRKISPLFDAPGVSFVVSVPDEALDNFELRAVATRDEVASSYGEMIRMKPLPLNRCCELLLNRGVATQSKLLPELLATLSAGSPRDLVRLTRETFSRSVVNRSPPDGDLPERRNDIPWAGEMPPGENFRLSVDNRRWASIEEDEVKKVATAVLERAARDVCGAAIRTLDRIPELPDDFKKMMREGLTIKTVHDLRRLSMNKTGCLHGDTIPRLKRLRSTGASKNAKAREERDRNINYAITMLPRLRTKLLALSFAASNLDLLFSDVDTTTDSEFRNARQKLFEILTLNNDSPAEALNHLEALKRLNSVPWQPPPQQTKGPRLTGRRPLAGLPAFLSPVVKLATAFPRE